MATESSGVVESSSTMPQRPTLLTFLIADVRGYTRFTAEHGDDAAARLTSRFAETCEDVVGAHAGEVIELRGDEALCVFPSARTALRAAVALQAAFREAMEHDPSLPLKVGVGLDAGEAIPVKGGYRGGALNLAARLCSLAGPGEVFASEGMVHVARKTDGIAFVDRGEVALKGLASPVRVIQIASEGELPDELPPLQPILMKHSNNLPDEPTPFIGREREISETAGLLREPHIRMVTLTGPGGTGKTRLALQVGSILLHDFADGVFFVNLAPLADAALVSSAIAEVLGVKEETGTDLLATLTNSLQAKHLLLVLDNYEHLLDASSSVVSSLLDACRELHVLVTSRIPLHLSREHEYPVPPLAVPDPNHLPDVATLCEYGAVALFADRARAVKADFQVTNDNAPAVAEICYRLDGLPLAIELAAARIKLFPPQALLHRLSSRLKLLTGGAKDRPTRQQTLRNTIDWSYCLLTEEVQTLFAGLSVFVGGCTFDAAEAVCDPAGNLDLLEGMASLVDKNLLRQEGDDEPRFFMLHVIREYALERLAEAPDAFEIPHRHATVFADLVESGWTSNSGPEQKRWLDKLELEHDNLRAAVAWAIREEDSALASRLLVSLWRFWQMRGHLFEAALRAQEVLAIPGLAEQKLDKYRTLEAAGSIAYWQGDQDTAGRYYGEAVEIARTLADRPTLAEALYNAGFPWMMTRTDPLRAAAIFDEALAIFRELADGAGVAKTLWGAAIAKAFADPPDFDGAIQMLLEARDGFIRLEDAAGLGWAHYVLGWDYTAIGRYADARENLLMSLDIFSDLEDRSGAVLLLDQFAVLAVAEADPERAARLAGARSELEAVSGVGLLGSRQSIAPQFDEAVAELPQIHPDAFAAGRAMDLDKAIALAREP